MGWVVNATPRPLYRRYPLYRRLVWPQGRSGRVHKISPPLGFDARTVQPVASRYADWAIPVPVSIIRKIDQSRMHVAVLLERIRGFQHENTEVDNDHHQLKNTQMTAWPRLRPSTHRTAASYVNSSSAKCRTTETLLRRTGVLTHYITYTATARLVTRRTTWSVNPLALEMDI